MIKLHHYKRFITFLIVAFASIQLASAHIHLPDHHDHDGNHHQHASQGHLHDLASHHDNIDTPPSQDKHNVVELDHKCTSHAKNKLNDHAELVTLSATHHYVLNQFTQLVLSASVKHKSSWLAYSNIRTRAPPLSTF